VGLCEWGLLEKMGGMWKEERKRKVVEALSDRWLASAKSGRNARTSETWSLLATQALYRIWSSAL
jgi:hypothetical protein